MEMTSTRSVPAPVDTVWAALNDPAMLTACIPGCDSIEPDGENAYRIAMAARIGPVSAKFTGRMQLADIDAPARLHAVVRRAGRRRRLRQGRGEGLARPGGERRRDGAVVHGEGAGRRQDRADRLAARRRRGAEARGRFLRALFRCGGGEGGGRSVRHRARLPRARSRGCATWRSRSSSASSRSSRSRWAR